MQYTTVALALSGAALTKAANIGGMMPAAVSTLTSSHDSASMLADSLSASGVAVDPAPGALTSSAPSVIVSYATVTLPCSTSSPVSTIVAPVATSTQPIPTIISTITVSCSSCTSSTVAVPVATSKPEETVTVQSTASHVSTVAVPAATSSSERTSTITNTTTQSRTQTITLSKSSTTAASIGVPFSVSAPHSFPINGTGSTLAHGVAGSGTGTARPFGTASNVPGSSLLPLSNDAIKTGGANFAIIAFGLVLMAMRA